MAVPVVVLVLGPGLLVPAVRREISARMSTHTVQDRIVESTPRVMPLWNARIPGGADAVQEVLLVVLKQERELRIYARLGPTPVLAATYPVLAASGIPGPKLREGDRQVPEGFYRVSSLNPNSRFHLSLRVNYPSDEDVQAARSEGRDVSALGGDIMIHGGAKSIGCVAIGDREIEEVFWLVATVGLDRTRVMISPGAVPAEHLPPTAPQWLQDRYARLGDQLRTLGIGG